MKKALLIFLTLAMLLSLCACRTPQSGERQDERENIPPEQAMDEENNLSKNLIFSLTEYLKNLHTEYEMPETSFVEKMEQIKNAHSSLHVKFNSSKYYYACAYYGSDHENEAETYCCVADYTWVRYDNEGDIREYRNDAPLVVAFQINQQLFARNIILDDTTNQEMEHYQVYQPVFEEGMNVASSIVFDSTFIYISQLANEQVIYHSVDAYNHDWITIPCIELEDQYYLIFPLYTEYTDGYRSEVNLVQEFGTYYDDLLNIMVTDQYDARDENGTTYYGLFEINDFTNHFLKAPKHIFAEDFECTRKSQRGGVKELAFRMLEEDVRTIELLLENATWEKDCMKLSPDYVFSWDDKEIHFYGSYINDWDNKKHFQLSGEQRKLMEDILAKYPLDLLDGQEGTISYGETQPELPSVGVDLLCGVVNGAVWTLGKPKAICSYKITLDGRELEYSPEGVLHDIANGRYTQVRPDQKNKINALIELLVGTIETSLPPT